MKKILFLSCVLFILSAFSGCGYYNDYARQQQQLDAESKGKATLLEAESSKKVAIETARANLESAKLNAQADSIRARGIANANAIIGESLEGNRAYLEWLWIDNIEKNQNAVYYIPTEGKMPIFNLPHAKKEISETTEKGEEGKAK